MNGFCSGGGGGGGVTAFESISAFFDKGFKKGLLTPFFYARLRIVFSLVEEKRMRELGEIRLVSERKMTLCFAILSTSRKGANDIPTLC